MDRLKGNRESQGNVTIRALLSNRQRLKVWQTEAMSLADQNGLAHRRGFQMGQYLVRKRL
jgi:hypothetical protein